MIVSSFHGWNFDLYMNYVEVCRFTARKNIGFDLRAVEMGEVREGEAEVGLCDRAFDAQAVDAQRRVSVVRKTSVEGAPACSLQT